MDFAYIYSHVAFRFHARYFGSIDLLNAAALTLDDILVFYFFTASFLHQGGSLACICFFETLFVPTSLAIYIYTRARRRHYFHFKISDVFLLRSSKSETLGCHYDSSTKRKQRIYSFEIRIRRTMCYTKHTYNVKVDKFLSSFEQF